MNMSYQAARDYAFQARNGMPAPFQMDLHLGSEAGFAAAIGRDDPIPAEQLTGEAARTQASRLAHSGQLTHVDTFLDKKITG